MLFYFACEAAGASSARHSLRPLNFQMRFTTGKLAREMRSEIAEVWVKQQQCLASFETRRRRRSSG
jgi:hypothetical protein